MINGGKIQTCINQKFNGIFLTDYSQAAGKFKFAQITKLMWLRLSNQFSQGSWENLALPEDDLIIFSILSSTARKRQGSNLQGRGHHETEIHPGGLQFGRDF